MRYSRRRFVRSLSAAGVAGMTVSSRTTGAAYASGDARPPQLHPLQPVPAQQVTIDDSFWSPKLKVWQEVTIRDCFHKFENDRGGALNNFDKVRDRKTGGHAGPPWYDGLIYEMIRGSADFLAQHPDPELETQLDGYIARIAAAAATNRAHRRPLLG